jgi:ABC-type lipoprotein export system ATPase subunit
MTPAVDVDEAFRIYAAATGRAVALQGLTLTVAEGEIVVVLGPSGSGKTTLLRVLGGFESLSAGSASVLGVDVANLSGRALARFRAANLGLLDQHYARALSPDLSCGESVSLTLELLGDPHRHAHAEARKLLRRVGLEERFGDRPQLLSGGEQQRVAVCAALIHRPRLLLADEPGGELDETTANLVYQLIEQLVRERAGSALIVSHDDAAATIADRLVFVRDGRVVEEQRRTQKRTIVVNGPGWIRLPKPVLATLEDPRRIDVSIGDQHALLRTAEAGRPRETSDLPPAPPPSRGRVIARVEAVERRFRDDAPPALPPTTASFHAGSFAAVVGRSGSGKTTLLHLLAGLDRPDRGRVIVNDVTLNELPRAATAEFRRRYIAVVGQEPGLVPHLSALENVELGLKLRGLDEDAAEEALTMVGLSHRLEHRANKLSAGERQRVAIARAAAVRPTLLLADEPTARLDEENAELVGQLIVDLCRSTQVAVICATHDETLVARADLTLTLGRVAHTSLLEPSTR